MLHVKEGSPGLYSLSSVKSMWGDLWTPPHENCEVLIDAYDEPDTDGKSASEHDGDHQRLWEQRP